MDTYRRRWSDNDHNFGPFTYARDNRGYRPLAVVLHSGDGDEYPGCSFRISAFGHTIIIGLPGIIKPWRQKVIAPSWDAATVSRLGRDWYWDIHPREYGFSCSDGHLIIYLGRQTHDSSTTQSWSKFLPWTQWRHVRHSLYGLDGQHFWTEDEFHPREWDAWHKAKDDCPAVTFCFTDFDGEQLTARTIIEEREWLFGEGWFKWLSLFRKPKIRRSLDLEFSGETGQRKGSWKGGTIGHSIDMLPGEMHEAAIRRYCTQHDMTFEASTLTDHASHGGEGRWAPTTTK